jgi:hypothetical protein
VHLQRNDGFSGIRQFLVEENIYRPVSGGTYAGEDGRTLIDEAIDWWLCQLDEIDRRMIEQRGNGHAPAQSQ